MNEPFCDALGILNEYVPGCSCTKCTRAKKAGKPAYLPDVQLYGGREGTSMNRPHSNSCFCTMCAMLFSEGKDDPILQRPKKSPEETQEAPAGQAQDDSTGTLIPGSLSDLVWKYTDTVPVGKPLRVKWIEDILRDFHERSATLHPHTNCPRCSEEKKPPEAGDPELQALISCMRTSAQETLVSLHKKGWKIVQA